MLTQHFDKDKKTLPVIGLWMNLSNVDMFQFGSGLTSSEPGCLCFPCYLEWKQKEERPLHRVVALQDFASSLREQEGGVFPFATPRHALVVVEIVATQRRTVTRPVAESKIGGKSNRGGASEQREDGFVYL